ncbi:PP2C family protein-serine/threonine phosphatase, partial [Streptomyces sp. NPDC058960]|uniref:PP2C family protein-serine/threonine phosphatase n=1 Tax=Streptomyces sp. NPDC058960 TaxID=3346679 RepID=UPI003698A0BE
MERHLSVARPYLNGGDEELLRALAARRAALPPIVEVPTLGDLQLRNVLLADDETLGLFDFERSEYAPQYATWCASATSGTAACTACPVTRAARPAEIQWSLLPPLAMSTPRIELAGMLEPAYDVAGDSFHYALNGDVLHVAMVDAMGHGLDAATMATVVIGAYRHARRISVGLSEIYAFMDRA